MARRDTAAMAAASWPDANYQFLRGKWWDEAPDARSRRRGPGRGRNQIEADLWDRDEINAQRRSAQWAAAERVLFGERVL
jgi:hypothetical protein